MRSYRVFYYSTSGMKIPSIGAFCYRIFYIFFQCPAGRRPGSGSPCVPPALCFWVIVAGMPGGSLCNAGREDHVMFISFIQYISTFRLLFIDRKSNCRPLQKVFHIPKAASTKSFVFAAPAHFPCREKHHVKSEQKTCRSLLPVPAARRAAKQRNKEPPGSEKQGGLKGALGSFPLAELNPFLNFFV